MTNDERDYTEHAIFSLFFTPDDDGQILADAVYEQMHSVGSRLCDVNYGDAGSVTIKLSGRPTEATNGRCIFEPVVSVSMPKRRSGGVAIRVFKDGGLRVEGPSPQGALPFGDAADALDDDGDDVMDEAV